MKKFSKINESQKDPIDPTADIEDFKEMFMDEIPGLYEVKIDKICKNITDAHPTMTEMWNIYRIYIAYENEEDNETVMYVKAISHDHAKIKASTIKNDTSILIPEIGGDYPYKSAYLSEREVKLKLDELEEEMEMLKNPK